jgi:hypothetical protein
MSAAVYASHESERLSATRLLARRRAETEQQRAYAGLEAARRAAGVARIVMGVHLVSLQESEGWQGRTGAKSFRRFLLEEGMEPRAAFQYMTVARAFVLEHGVSPEAIALVGMRVLVDAAQYLHSDDPAAGLESNVDDIVSLVRSLPAAEAHAALRERYSPTDPEPKTGPRLSKPVSKILGELDSLTHDERAELYQVLRATPAHVPKEAESANDISDTTKA